MSSAPTRYAAFMRAINVGRRRVKMADLVDHVETLGFTDVRTLIASGNVALTDPSGRSLDVVRSAFDEGLSDRLGFEVVSALRTAAHLDAVVAAEPFGPPEDPDAGWTEDDVVHVSFLLDEPPAEAHRRFAELDSPEDRFAIIGTELYWRRRGKLTDSPIEPRLFNRALGVDSTARRLDTVKKMVSLLRQP